MMIYITLRFDDGTISQYTNAFQYMSKYNMPGSVYVIGEKVGLTGYINLESLLIMQNAGWEIGYHSLTHDRNWINIDHRFQRETDSSRLKNAGLHIRTFALPHSVSNEKVISHLGQPYEGIAGAPSHLGNSMKKMPPRNLFKCITITSSTPVATVNDRIQRAIKANEY